MQMTYFRRNEGQKYLFSREMKERYYEYDITETMEQTFVHTNLYLR